MSSEVGSRRAVSACKSRHSEQPSPRGASRLTRQSRGLLIAALAVLTGCSSSLVLSSGPKPRVEDCMLLQQATPTRYVCDGKTYTAVQLADLRKNVGDIH